MGYFAIEDEEELQHHGILGQKWGVRRFQRPDGTRTAAGKKRQRENYENAQNGGHKKEFDKEKAKKIAKGVALGVAGAAAAYGAAKFIKEYNEMPDFLKKELKDAAKTKLTDIGEKAKNKFGERLSKVGDRMIDAALISVGGIAVAHVNKKFSDDENASDAERAKNQIIRDTAKAGIETITNANGSSSNKNKTWSDRTGTHAGKEISDKIGPPSNKNIDRSSKEWQDLFKDSNGNQRDADTRATIKSLANAGYDIEQIDKYLNHSEFDLTPYMALEIRW